MPNAKEIYLASDTDAYNLCFYGSTAAHFRDATLGMQGDLLYYDLHHAALQRARE